MTLGGAPSIVDLTLSHKGDQDIRVRGVALAADGKFLTLAHLFATISSVLLSGDSSHTACLGWQARDPDHDWLVIKVRTENCIPARTVAAFYLNLTPGDPLYIPLPRPDAPLRGITAQVSSPPDGTAADSSSDLWISASPEELLPGTPVLDRHHYLVGLIDRVVPDAHLAHVVKAEAPLAALDRAAHRSEVFAWNQKDEAAPPPFDDPTINPETLHSLQTAQGPDWDKAADRLLQDHPKSPLAWYEAALGYERNRNPERALASARMLAQLAPKQAAGWILLGNEFDAAKNYAGAIDAYQNAIENGARNTEVALPFALSLLHSGDTHRALDQLSALCQEEPEIYGAWLAFGEAQQSSGQFPEAISSYLRAIRLDPQSREAWSALATIDERNGSPSDAIESYKQLLLLSPRDASIWRRFGQLQAKDRPADALRSFHNVVLIDPRDRDAWIELARLSAGEGDFDEAETDSRKALEIDPQSGAGWAQLGWAEFNQNRSDQAEAAWRRAVEIDPNDIESWSHLARLQYIHGGLAGAAPALSQLEKIAPAEVASLKAAWSQEGGTAASPFQ